MYVLFIFPDERHEREERSRPERGEAHPMYEEIIDLVLFVYFPR